MTTTITIKINERSKAGKTLKDLIDMLKEQPGVEVINNESESPYDPEFVAMVKKSAASKERYRIENVEELWESL